jgi:tetratricopeptide (TPR) repeat protein
MLTERGQVKVLDFGLAKIAASRSLLESQAETQSMLTETGLIIGTVPYMSPEQVRAESLDARSDIFSFGSLLYEVISGHHPFAAKTVAETISAILVGDIKPLSVDANDRIQRLDQIVRKCLEKDREKRYQDVAAVAADLEGARGDFESGRVEAAKLYSSNVATKVVPSDSDGKPSGFHMPAFLKTGRRQAAAAIVLLSVIVIGYGLIGGSLRKHATTDDSTNSAYDNYLRGKVIAGSQNRKDNETAIKLLEQAVEADRKFAPAWAELARAYTIKAFYYVPEAESKHWIREAEVAVQQALALDPNLAEGHDARAFLLWTHPKGFPHKEAIQEYQRALQLNPNLEEAHHSLATIYFHIGLLDKAWAKVEDGMKINPANTLMRFRYGVINIYRTKYKEALDILNTIPPDVNPSIVKRNIATALFQLGKTDEVSNLVEEYLRSYPDDEGGAITSIKAMLLAKAGKEKEAEDTIADAIRIGKGFGHFHHTAYNIASAYALLNKRSEAIKWLEEAANDGFPCYPWFAKDDNLKSLRTDDAFIAFMAALRKRWEDYNAQL